MYICICMYMYMYMYIYIFEYTWYHAYMAKSQSARVPLKSNPATGLPESWTVRSDWSPKETTRSKRIQMCHGQKGDEPVFILKWLGDGHQSIHSFFFQTIYFDHGTVDFRFRGSVGMPSRPGSKLDSDRGAGVNVPMQRILGPDLAKMRCDRCDRCDRFTSEVEETNIWQLDLLMRFFGIFFGQESEKWKHKRSSPNLTTSGQQVTNHFHEDHECN